MSDSQFCEADRRLSLDHRSRTVMTKERTRLVMTELIEREEGESWRRVVERIATAQGTQIECLQAFDQLGIVDK
jgi:hypothetical protein